MQGIKNRELRFRTGDPALRKNPYNAHIFSKPLIRNGKNYKLFSEFHKKYLLKYFVQQRFY
jgi:hypothetical protein